jgi:hypothetical protein
MIGLGKIRFGKAGLGTVKVADGSTEGSCSPCRPQSGFGMAKFGTVCYGMDWSHPARFGKLWQGKSRNWQ